jgi:hypothetical protein
MEVGVAFVGRVRDVLVVEAQDVDQRPAAVIGRRTGVDHRDLILWPRILAPLLSAGPAAIRIIAELRG